MPSSPPPPREPDFDRVAWVYRWAEYLALGPLLQQTRTAFLDQLGGCEQALLFGDGDGRFLAQLLLRYPALHATTVDTSAVMLRLLQARCQGAVADADARLTIIHASALQTPIPPATDLIVTHFFLDCLSQEDVDHLTRSVAASTKPGTRWLLSDFEVPRSPWLRPLARLYIRSLYLAFRLLTGQRVQHLPDPQASLARAGFRRVARRSKLFGLLYSELWVLGDAYRHNPAEPEFIHIPMLPENGDPAPPPDPLPDPEPPVPSLAEPDPGVFHRDPESSPRSETGS